MSGWRFHPLPKLLCRAPMDSTHLVHANSDAANRQEGAIREKVLSAAEPLYVAA
jgi:hypothetical protein